MLAAAKILNDECDTKVSFHAQKLLLIVTYSLVISALFFCSIFYIWTCSCPKPILRKFRPNVTRHSLAGIIAVITFAFFTIIKFSITSKVMFDCLNENLSLSTSPSNSSLKDISGYALTRGLTVVLSCLFLTLSELLKPTEPSTGIKIVKSVGSIALILGNGVLWLETFMISLSEKSLVFNAIETDKTCLQRENVAMCLDSRHNYSKTLRPFFIPFLTEYSLAALLIGLHSLTGDDADSSGDSEAVSDDKEFATESTENGFLLLKRDVEEDTVNFQDFGWIVGFIIFFLLPLIVICSVLLFENEVTISTNGFTNESEENLNNVAILTLALNAAGLFATMVAFACCYKATLRQETKQTWKEIVLILSLSSLFFSWPLQVDFDVSCKATRSDSLHCHSHRDSFYNINIAFAVIPAIESGCQVCLLLYLKRIYLPRTQRLIFSLSVLAVTNFVLWVIDTFYWSEKHLFLQQASKGSTDREWHFYTTVLLSITIFFRYECAVTFFFALAETLKKHKTIRSFLQKGQFMSKFTLQKIKLDEKIKEDRLPFRFKLYKGTELLSSIHPVLEEILGTLKDKLKLKNDDCLWPPPKEILRGSHNEEKIPLMPVILEKLVLLRVTLPGVRKELHAVLVLSDSTTVDVCHYLQYVILKDKDCFCVTAKIKDSDLDILLWESIDDICRTQKKSKQFLMSLNLQMVECEPFQFTDDNDVRIDAITGIRFNKEIFPSFHMKNRVVKKTEETLIKKICFLRKLRVNNEEELVEVGDPEQRERIEFEFTKSTEAKAINICEMIALTRISKNDFPFCVITYNQKSVIVLGETKMCPDLLTSQSNSKPECFFAVWENEEPQQKEFTITAEVHVDESQREEILKFSWPAKHMPWTTLKSAAAALLKCKLKSCYWKGRSRAKTEKEIVGKRKEQKLIVHKDKTVFFYKDEVLSMSENDTLEEVIQKCIDKKPMSDGEAKSYKLLLNEKLHSDLSLRVGSLSEDEVVCVQIDRKEKYFQVIKSEKTKRYCYQRRLHCFLDMTGKQFRAKCAKHLRLKETEIQSICVIVNRQKKDVDENAWLAEIDDLENSDTVEVTLNSLDEDAGDVK